MERGLLPMNLIPDPPGQNGHPLTGRPFIEELRQTILRQKKYPWQPKELNPAPVLHWGWLVPELLRIDLHTWQRWGYWIVCMEKGELIDAPIPQITWGTDQDTPALKMLQACLDSIPRSGGWQTWSGWTYFNYMMDWLLFAFGYAGQRELPPEPGGCEGASIRLYQIFCLESMLGWPYDYWGDLLAENRHGKSLGFYPTPMDVAQLMIQILFLPGDKDHRTTTLCDPCLGTGRLPLAASNYTLRIYGQDIDATVIKATLVNSYLYAPWIVKPFPFLDAELLDPAYSASISNALTKVGSAKPDAARYLAGTEYDRENQWQFEPIKKRRRISGEPQPATFEDLFRVRPEEQPPIPEIVDSILNSA